MGIAIVGTNHKTAPIEVRERLAFTNPRLAEALHEMVDREAISEGLIISTCNRVELIAATPNGAGGPENAVSRLYDFLSRFHQYDLSLLRNHFYDLTGPPAIKHVFRIASSLDSMVLGEAQITGQVKEAFQRAHEAAVVGHELTRLMNRAFAVAKRVRNETGIGLSAVSVSFVAVELARKIVKDLKGSVVMLIGAGEMAELAAKHLLNHGADRLLISDRDFENAAALAHEINGEAVGFDEFEKRLPETDVLICSTDTQDYLIRPRHVRRALERRGARAMLLIDISAPRSIDPLAGWFNNAFLFNVDDLESIADANRAERGREALRAEEIIQTEAEQFIGAMGEGDLNDIIGAFRRQVSEMAFAEFERTRKRLGQLNEDQEQALQVMINAIVNRLTHPVINQLRESKDGHSLYLSAWRDLHHCDRKERRRNP